ncbi:MAG TPA: transposase, partial [Gemmataceae bacterium]|nr:transposase [Gemmataceae bacterium]
MTRLPTAPTEPMPELAEFLAPFRVEFARREGPAALERYCTGLLTGHPNKNCDTPDDLVPGTSEQRLRGLLTTMAWDEDDLNRQRVGVMAALPTEGGAVLVFDDTGFPKHGAASVGVARQYSGALGKTGHCRVAVTCQYAERTLDRPVAARLYLPRPWAGHPDRRTTAGVPEGVAFRTKPEIAPGLLDRARAWGCGGRAWRPTATTGTTRTSWPGWTNAGTSTWSRSASTSPSRPPAGPRNRRSGRTPWWGRCRPGCGGVSGGGGSKGWLRGRFAAVRCWRVTSDGTGHLGWLIGEREARGQDERRKFFWSTFGPEVPLERPVGYAHRRHWVEQYYEGAKTLLGWDQYQGRLWRGFHRHAVAVVVPGGLLDQPVPELFFLAYSGSGLVIQCLARCHPIRNRFSARRIASIDSSRGVHPFSWQTSATRASVHRLVTFPNSRGRRWSKSLRSSSRSRSHTRPGSWRAWDLALREASPSASNARMALRTAWAVHPITRPTSAGPLRPALASRIWDRRAVNASVDFRPFSSACRSPAVRGRTNVRALFIQ